MPLQARHRTRSDGGVTATDPDGHGSSHPSSASTRLDSLTALGAKMRSYTTGGHGIHHPLAPQDASSSRSHRPSFSFSTSIASPSSNIQPDGKRSRRTSRLLSSLTASMSRASVQPVRPSSSSGSSSMEKGRHSVHEYSIASLSTSVEGDDWQPGRGRQTEGSGEDNAHNSSAVAYLSDNPTGLVATSVPASPRAMVKNRRLSIPSLSRRWSKGDLLSSPLTTASGLVHDDVVVPPGLANVTDSNRGSFNLRSFRNVRKGSTTSIDKSPYFGGANDDEHAHIQDDRPDRPSTLQYPTDLGIHSLPDLHPTPPPLPSKPTSPLSSNPASPRPEQARSRSGSMSVGTFLRAAARSRQDLSSALDDEPGSPLPQPSEMDSPGGLRGHASPYRPLTPLGSGARSPGEELALLEADLARARSNSLMYLAQMEEERMQREERRRSRHGALGFVGRGVETDDGRPSDEMRCSYFPPYREQSPRPRGIHSPHAAAAYRP